jgi:methyltransferase (TIGR00027 family)
MHAAPQHIASQTAVTVAVLRAAHQLFDETPKILEDRVVLDLLPPPVSEDLRAHPERFQAPAVRGLRSHVVVRSRFAEDRLAEAAGRGVRQCVVLGAGYDTFGFRQPAWASPLRIFEVDQPATQAFKRERLAAAGIAVPDNVLLVPIDFESERLAERLAAAGVQLDRPVFFSWLGVTVYLTSSAIDAVFRMVASLPPSSEIVFTFTQPLSDRPEDAARVAMAERAAAVGEPWITFFEPQKLVEDLRALGFASVDLLTPAETSARYFRGRSDLFVPRQISIAAAIR